MFPPDRTPSRYRSYASRNQNPWPSDHIPRRRSNIFNHIRYRWTFEIFIESFLNLIDGITDHLRCLLHDTLGCSWKFLHVTLLWLRFRCGCLVLTLIHDNIYLITYSISTSKMKSILTMSNSLWTEDPCLLLSNLGLNGSSPFHIFIGGLDYKSEYWWYIACEWCPTRRSTSEAVLTSNGTHDSDVRI